MDILIKSFNRPYYLDRCIQSIYLNCTGLDFNIKVLDDGTPQKYLDKLQEKFPEISISKSAHYDEKVACTAVGKEPEIKSIPIDLWVESAEKASDYFILLEDDIWFTEEINLKNLTAPLQQNKVQFVKLSWLGNPKLIQKKSQTVLGDFTIYKPKLFTSNEFLFYCIFYKLNRFGIRKMFEFLRIHTFDRMLSYYSIYSVAGVLFDKNYFLKLWKNHTNEVNEGLQLYNALQFYNANKTIYFGHTHNEIVKTGFSTSATSQIKNGALVDMFAFNFLLNEAWFTDHFDAMNNYPKDFDENQIHVIITNNSSLISPKNWSNWKREFKRQYENFGCQID